MDFFKKKSFGAILLFSLTIAPLMYPQQARAEEKSLWQKFVDWFKPSPAIEGEGPLYDELKALEEKIDKAEGRYSRERRPGNKSRIKKEIETMKAERASLIERIEAGEKSKESAKKEQVVSVAASSSSLTQSSASCKTDTVFVRDTVVVHDTLYVIVANRPEPVARDSVKADTLEAEIQKIQDSTAAESNVQAR